MGENKVIEVDSYLAKDFMDSTKSSGSFPPLHDAAYHGKEDVVSLILLSGTSPDECMSDKQTAAHVTSSAEVIKTLAKANANLDIQDDKLRTPLHTVQMNHGNQDEQYGALEELLNQGANPNITDKYKRTPLHIATENDDDDAVKILLDSKKTNINVKDNKGMTPLMTAVQSNSIDTVISLLEANARVYMRNDNGDTALQIAKENNVDEDIIEVLQQYNASRRQPNSKPGTKYPF